LNLQIPTLSVAEIEIPAVFERLHDLAYNLCWCWSPRAQRLFRAMDAEHWKRYANPVQLLIGMRPRNWEQLLSDPGFRDLYVAAIGDLDAYLSRPRARVGDEALSGPVAYFSMEFGIHESLGVYSGGLGVLAGDHCKAASDLGVPLIGVSLLYRSGYFRQTVDADGYQQHIYPDYDFSRLPVRPVLAPDGGVLTVPVDLPGRSIQAAVWLAQVGHVPVLLLDTDISANDPADRPITGILYVRGREMRLCQEVVLGVGGVRALSALGIRPSVWHMNEGHVAFLGLERARALVAGGDGLAHALESVARDTVFTTHTPVPAGNETYDRELARRYLEPWTRAVGCDSDEAIGLGSENGQFNMTVLAIKLSSSANGVSRLHGDTASAMWRHLWPDAPEQPIHYVTNGVHTPSWVGPEMRRLYARHLGEDWQEHLAEPEYWQRIAEVPDAEIWDAHRQQKERLIRFVRERLRAQAARHGGAPDELRAVDTLLDPGALTIGFARRFATYKRAVLLISDLDRLLALVRAESRPVQFLFAGKAHPADRAGQDMIRRLFGLTGAELRGRLVFIEDYDMLTGRMLVQGCDVWLNTPRRPQEASGTSGQKVPVNGGLNLSIPDGWWAEGYRGDNGWSIGEGTWGSTEEQDARDGEALYKLLEEQVVPTYYERDEQGLPRGWVAMMKASIESVLPTFSAHRMVRDYVEQAYLPAARRGALSVAR
jgi:starch phosphorylase